ncbi:MAG: alpha/beta hydrolase [Provencibacterium sp.]|jgi:predicted alpha/beta superfamily hydrolase|nr:alpha/beta hydrolase [Provencibacterium sp.]
MQGKTEERMAFNRRLTLYLPPVRAKERLPVAYLQDGAMVKEMLEQLAAPVERAVKAGSCRPFLLVAVHSDERDAEYTPWPAGSAFSKGDNYSGRADDYLKMLESGIKPLIDSLYPTLPEPEQTAIGGYSLGGLCALYAAFKSGAFGRFASISGSLWYPGWRDFVKENPPARPFSALWVSLGKKEPKASHPLLAGSGEAALQTERLLSPYARRHTFVWHEGGHFAQVAQRMAQTLCWLFQREESDEDFQRRLYR